MKIRKPFYYPAGAKATTCFTFYCDACGEPFKPRRVDARTCSGKCRVALHRRRTAAEEVDRAVGLAEPRRLLPVDSP